MIGSTDKSKHHLPTASRRFGAKVRAVVWVTLVSWLFTFTFCAVEAVASVTVTAAGTDLESVTPHGSSDGHHHPQMPHTDSCCTLQKIPVPASTAALSTPLHDPLVAVLPLLLILPFMLFMPFRTRLHTTGPPGRSRHLLLAYSIRPNAPPY
jgi:hypothetical protein